MDHQRPYQSPTQVQGMLLACAAYVVFSVQDAITKWLVADYEVAQILVIRSLVVFALSERLARHRRYPSAFSSPRRGIMVLRSALLLVAWVSLFTAARYMPLGELTTLYFCAPVLIVILSHFFLKEHAGPARWMACIVGFVGIILAANPTRTPDLLPALLVILAAFCWAASTILVRVVSRQESSVTQMSATALFFVVVCSASLPWLWKTPDLNGWMLMIALGLLSTIGQFLLFEGIKYAPASAIAPTEYTGLVWAFMLGFLLWSEVPTYGTLAGAILIVGSSIALILWEKASIAKLGR